MDTGCLMPAFYTYLFVILICLINNSRGFLLDSDLLSRCPVTVAHGRYLHMFRDRCIEFVINNQKYWADARHDCQEKGGDLVVISDADTQNFIMTTLRNLGNTHDGIWIGLTDQRHELHWEWVNGEPLTGYNHWAHKQGGANALHFTQDCAQIRIDDHGLWHDRECHLWPNKYPYICEFEMLPMPSTTTERTTSTTSSTVSSTKFTTTTSSTTMTTRLSTTKTTDQPLTITTRQTALVTNPKTTIEAMISSTLLNILSTKRANANISPTAIDGETSSKPSKTSIDTSETLYSTTDFKPFHSAENSTQQTVPQTKSTTISDADIKTSESDIRTSGGSLHSASLSVLSTKFPVTSSSTAQKHECTFVDCDTVCPHGYSGLFVGTDGCVECNCF